MPMIPQPTSPNPQWDPAVLMQTERELARLVGPVARLLVRRAAAATTDLDLFYYLLAERLSEDDRAAFLGVAAHSSRPKPPEPAASKWDPELLKQLEHRLAHLKGPVAHLMVRRAAAWTDDLDALYRILAERLASPEERAWLLAGLRPVPLPGAATAQVQPSKASAAQRMSGFVDPIARSIAGFARKRRRAVVLDAEAQPEIVKQAEERPAPPRPAAAPRAAVPASRDRLANLPLGAWRSTVPRLFPEDLRVRLAPAEVLAGASSIACDPALGAEPWQGAIATLKNMEWTKPCKVTVVLSNHFVRYAVIPWSDGLATPAEEQAYLRHHFAKIHGERAKSWTPRASEERRGLPRLASAIDTALLEELRGALPRGGKASLVSVQPELMEAINRWRDAIPRAGAWLVLAEPERACVAMHCEGAWRSVQNAKGDWLTLLDRERYRVQGGLQEVPGLVLLAGARAPQQSDGWQFRELTA
jgi:hypothetical protein